MIPWAAPSEQRMSGSPSLEGCSVARPACVAGVVTAIVDRFVPLAGVRDGFECGGGCVPRRSNRQEASTCGSRRPDELDRGR
jgi:hypothetical protein